MQVAVVRPFRGGMVRIAAFLAYLRHGSARYLGVRVSHDRRGLLSLRRQGDVPVGIVRRCSPPRGSQLLLFVRDALAELSRASGFRAFDVGVEDSVHLDLFYGVDDDVRPGREALGNGGFVLRLRRRLFAASGGHL